RLSLETSRRTISSGNGSSRRGERRPASTCATGIPARRIAISANRVYAVSPCTSPMAQSRQARVRNRRIASRQKRQVQLAKLACVAASWSATSTSSELRRRNSCSSSRNVSECCPVYTSLYGTPPASIERNTGAILINCALVPISTRTLRRDASGSWLVVCTPLPADRLVGQARDLFGDESDQEHDHCRT